VFRDESIDEVRRIAEIARLDIIQLHGSEPDAYVNAIGLPVIQAFKVGDALPETSSTAQWIMFDTGGGTGRRFDWSLLASYRRTKPFFLAGGLTPDNVADAIRETRPDAVDVSSGVESAPGVKDHQKLRYFFEGVRQT
jgi:phosphoribosylanthranilate isomerase